MGWQAEQAHKWFMESVAGPLHNHIMYLAVGCLVLIVCFYKLVSDGSLIVRVNANFHGIFPSESEIEIMEKRKNIYSQEHV